MLPPWNYLNDSFLDLYFYKHSCSEIPKILLMAPSNRHVREVVDSTTIKDFRSFWMASFLHLRLG